MDISGYEAIEFQLCLRGLGYQGSVGLACTGSICTSSKPFFGPLRKINQNHHARKLWFVA